MQAFCEQIEPVPVQKQIGHNWLDYVMSSY